MGERRGSTSVREVAKTIGLAVVIALGVRVGIAQAYQVDGPSMEPSLVTGERLFVLRAAYGLSVPFRTEALAVWAAPAPGDVVVVESPADGLDLVKRVIGVPGDVVEVRGGVVFRNGAPLAQRDLGPCDPARHGRVDAGCHAYRETLGERSWTTSRSVVGGGLDEDVAPVRVPAGHVYVMGDHRDRSNDSRYFGPVPLSHLRGRVLFVD
ncbi:MAG TPA: signal peptidase I [Sandaracinaceae bacterium LLY-WYZ-13_1]|nr:signal peptidase I [Sandaracinaceae bacterium LLY-WYZ-13_1]